MEKILPYLEQLANKLGIAVNHLWGVLVKQSITEGITSIVMATVYLSLIIVLYKCSPKIYGYIRSKHRELKEDRIKNGTGYMGSYSVSSNKEDFYNFWSSGCGICVGLTFLILLILFIVDLKYGIKCLYNPEYYALQKILEVMK